MSKKFGYIKSQLDLRDYKVYGLTSNDDLPTEFSLSGVPIKNQENVNSCVAFVLSEILEYSMENKYSTGWIYGYRPSDYYQGKGMSPRDALKTIHNLGAVEEYQFKYNLEIPDIKNLVDNNLNKLKPYASNCKISGYVKLSTVNDIKSWIYDKKIPILIAIQTNGLELEDNIIKIPNDYSNTGHALMVIGWNNDGFIVQNSWR